MKDYFYFTRRYRQIERDFLELTDFIEISNDFTDPCYKIGSSKLMDFCLRVGSEIETIFRIILNQNIFNSIENIAHSREIQSINIYQQIIEPKYALSQYILKVNLIDVSIKPFYLKRIFSLIGDLHS